MKTIFDYTITEDFINRRNARVKKFEESAKKKQLYFPGGAVDKRSWETRLLNADCELLEYVLCELNLHTDADSMEFDTFDEDKKRTEVKCISEGGSVTLKKWTLDQYFDMYLFFKFVTPHNQPFKAGDKTRMQIVERSHKEIVEDRAQRSQYYEKDKYVWPQNNAENYIQSDRNVL